MTGIRRVLGVRPLAERPSERCARCGYARINVRHETDPANAPEGPAYYADMLDRLHPFEPEPGT